MKVKSESEVAQLFPTLHDPVDCSLPGSSVHGIYQARVLEWGATAFSSDPIISWQIDGETVETERLYFLGGAPKSLQMVTAAMKLKDACSLEEKL